MKAGTTCWVRGFGVLVIALVGAALIACADEDAEIADMTSTPLPVTLTGAHAEVQTLLTAMESAEFRVIYELTVSPNDEPELRVIYNAPPRTRIDTIPAGEQEPASTLIGTGDGHSAISCEGGPGDWRCSEIADLGQSVLRTAAPITFFPRHALASYGVAPLDGRNIASEDARCFEIRPPEEGVIEYCFTDDGILVYSSPTFGTLRAIELSREVPDDAFSPPANPE